MSSNAHPKSREYNSKQLAASAPHGGKDHHSGVVKGQVKKGKNTHREKEPILSGNVLCILTSKQLPQVVLERAAGASPEWMISRLIMMMALSYLCKTM
tara:strand:- start:2601 stop:2894 length:294 start_codon:yes stop_codon:yes gene_type:complete